MHNHEPEQYTFWDYRVRNAVKNKMGWRIDHIWATRPLKEKSTRAWIDIDQRLKEKPSVLLRNLRNKINWIGKAIIWMLSVFLPVIVATAWASDLQRVGKVGELGIMHGSKKVRNLEITVSYDNNPYKEGLEAAWGFSCLIKGTEKTILVDTGGDV